VGELIGIGGEAVMLQIREGLIKATKASAPRRRWFIHADELAVLKRKGVLRPPAEPGSRWLTVPEFARRIGLTPAAVGYRVRQGHLRAFRMQRGSKMGSWLIPREELEKELRRRGEDSQVAEPAA
jgi:hypothetical protein